MKTATIFLVAVTVFASLLQQSSAAPADLGWDSLGSFVGNTIEEVGNALDGIKKNVDGFVNGVEKDIRNLMDLATQVKKRIESTDASLAKISKAIKEALGKATDVQKEDFKKVSEWLDGFKDFVATIHKELAKAVTDGTKEALESIVPRLSEAIKDIEADLAQVVKNLTGDVKAIIEKELYNIINNALSVQKAIKNVLSGKGVNAEIIDKVIEKLTKLIQKIIESSEANLTRIAKLRKEALDKATDSKVYEWLKDFGKLVASVHKKLINANTKQALEYVIFDVEKAIKDTEADWPKISENLTGEVKDILGDLVLEIVKNGKTILEAIKNFLSGKGVNEETIDKVIEKLTKLIQKIIESSEANLTRIAKLIKKALEKATGVEKEGLNVVYEWTNDFGVLVASVHKKLINANTKQALEYVIFDVEKAIKDTEADWPKISENLTGEVKDNLGDLVLEIVKNGKTILEAIKNVLSGQ